MPRQKKSDAEIMDAIAAEVSPLLRVRELLQTALDDLPNAITYTGAGSKVSGGYFVREALKILDREVLNASE